MVAHQEHPAPSLRAIRSDVSTALEAVYQRMMAKKPEDRPASMTEVIALLQASKLATDSDVGTVARPPAPTPAAEAWKQAPLKQGGPPRPIIDSAIFARRIEAEDTLIDSKLNLWDLVMDVPSEVGVTGEPGADVDEREGASDSHELNLRELAMELGEEAAAPAARKQPVAAAGPLTKACITAEGSDALRPAKTTCSANDNRRNRPHHPAKKKSHPPRRNRLPPMPSR